MRTPASHLPLIVSGSVPTVAKIAMVVTFWLAVFLIQKLNTLGVLKSVALAAIGASIPLLLRLIRPPMSRERVAESRAMTIAIATVVIAHVVYFGLRVAHPHLLDIATTTLDAGAAIWRGENPYELPIDTVSGGLADPAFHGYKYLPMMVIAYLPLGAALGERGVLVTNLLVHLAVAWMVWRVASRAGTRASGRLAAMLYLSLPLVAMQVLAKGATDIVAVAPLMLALLCLERNAMAAGLCIGLSISTKLLPGLVFVPSLLPAKRDDRVRYVLGIALGIIPVLPFALWSPVAFADNVLLFAVLRPVDSTSWLSAVSGDVAMLARLVAAPVFLAAAACAWQRQLSLVARCGLAATLTLLVILVGGSAHHNYQLWWLPLYCVLLAVAVEGQTDAARPGSRRHPDGARYHELLGHALHRAPRHLRDGKAPVARREG